MDLLGNALGGAFLSSLKEARESFRCTCNHPHCVAREMLEQDLPLQLVASRLNSKDLTPGRAYVMSGFINGVVRDAAEARFTTTDDDGVRLVGDVSIGNWENPAVTTTFVFSPEGYQAAIEALEEHFKNKREKRLSELTNRTENLAEVGETLKQLQEVYELSTASCPFNESDLIELREDFKTGIRPSRYGEIHIVLKTGVSGFMDQGEPYDMTIAKIDSDGERMIFNANSMRYKPVAKETNKSDKE